MSEPPEQVPEEKHTETDKEREDVQKGMMQAASAGAFKTAYVERRVMSAMFASVLPNLDLVRHICNYWWKWRTETDEEYIMRKCHALKLLILLH